ncbi:MAG: DUF4202 family protein [Patescibacteria group bacterium]
MKNFVETKKEITDIIMKYREGSELKHANGVLNWLLKIKPDADEVMQIAAFAHDIERCVRQGQKNPDLLFVGDPEKYKQAKREHAEYGARVLAEILKKHDVDEKGVARAVYLVENHEDGGDEEANIIRDADSLSYFEDNFDGYLKECGVERAKRKVEYMFGRMSENGKKLGLELYNEALKKIKN